MSSEAKLSDSPHSRLNRRSFLRLAVGGAAGAFLVSCTVPPAPNSGGQPAAGAAEAKAVSVFECCWNADHIAAGKDLYKEFQAKNPSTPVDVFWPAPGDDWA